jgi:AcrR family transcriptional regulator
VKPEGKRAERARATRRRIVDEARELFVGQGYAATTLEQIAVRAGVAVQTVYFHYGNKASVLKEIVDVLAAGDDEPIAVLDRPWVHEALAQPTGAEIIATWMRGSRKIFTRITPIMRVVRDAAGADAEMAAQWATNEEQRYRVHRILAAQLQEAGALRPGLTADRAADVIFTLVSPEVYALLTVARGWTPQEWEEWIVPTLGAAVLR